MMVLIQTATHKNVTCNVYADSLSKDGVYLKKLNYGYEPARFDEDFSKRESYSFWDSPKNENKREKITIEVHLFASSVGEKSNMLKQHQRNFEKLYSKVGGDVNNGKGKLFTMLKNKGY